MNIIKNYSGREEEIKASFCARIKSLFDIYSKTYARDKKISVSCSEYTDYNSKTISKILELYNDHSSQWPAYLRNSTEYLYSVINNTISSGRNINKAINSTCTFVRSSIEVGAVNSSLISLCNTVNYHPERAELYEESYEDSSYENFDNTFIFNGNFSISRNNTVALDKLKDMSLDAVCKIVNGPNDNIYSHDLSSSDTDSIHSEAFSSNANENWITKDFNSIISFVLGMIVIAGLIVAFRYFIQPMFQRKHQPRTEPLLTLSNCSTNSIQFNEVSTREDNRRRKNRA